MYLVHYLVTNWLDEVYFCWRNKLCNCGRNVCFLMILLLFEVKLGVNVKFLVLALFLSSLWMCVFVWFSVPDWPWLLLLEYLDVV